MKMKPTKTSMRKTLLAAMAAAYQEHLDEAAENPAIRKETWEDFFSSYCPATDDAMLDYNTVESHRTIFSEITRQTGGLGQ
jgi:hypothetical protein